MSISDIIVLRREKMKKKISIFITLILVLACALAISVSAASTNAFGTPEILDNIDLTGLAEDDDVYCVLFDGEEYHTYPSRYIVTNNTKMTWTLDKINDATKKEYSYASIIRFQLPSHVTTIPCIIGTFYGWKNESDIHFVEFSFPADTKVETFSHAAFEKCRSLESFIVPKTVKTINDNAFHACSGLTSFTFEEGSQVTALPVKFLSNCTALTEIVLPPSITSIAQEPFGGHAGALSKVVLSPNLSLVTGGALLNALGRSDSEFIEVYMPGCYATAQGSITSGNLIGRSDKSDLKKYVIYFTGTKEQAVNLVTKFSGDISLCDANIVAYDPEKTDGREYLGMEPYTTAITVNTNRVIIYGYNTCKAFYNDEHKLSDEVTEAFAGEKFLSEFKAYCGCTRKCGAETIIETLPALIVDSGYAYGPNAMAQGIAIKKELIEAYAKYFDGIKFGAYAALYQADGKVINADGTGINGYVAVSDYTNRGYDLLDMTIFGIAEAYQDTDFCFGAYIIADGEVYYINNAQSTEAAVAVSYNDVVAIVDAVPPQKEEEVA